VTRLLTAVAGVCTVILHVLGRYRHYWWWDNAAHFGAGVTIGGLITTDESSTVRDVGVFLGVAFLWELFEWCHGVWPWMSGSSDRAIEDTLLDTLVGAIGAWLASEVPNR